MFFLKKNHPFKKAGHLIFSIGMPRSGSTLHFNLIKEVINLSGDKINFFYAPNFKSAKTQLSELQEESEFVLIKTHRYERRMINLIKSQNVSAFYIYRDPIDAAASLRAKEKVDDFEVLLGQIKGFLNLKYNIMKNSKVHISRYENMMNFLELEIRTIAQNLNMKIDGETVSLIARKYNIKNVKKQIASDQDEVLVGEASHNASTFFHKDHITSDGQIGGGFKVFTDDEVKRLYDLENFILGEHLNRSFFNGRKISRRLKSKI